MNLSSPAQITNLLRRYDLHPKRRFGQNFLIDANILSKIVESANLSTGGQALEIGTGLGVLTSALAETVTIDGRVITVEIDKQLLPLLAETVASYPQVRIINEDVMDLNWEPFLSDKFHLDAASAQPTISVVANIPYNITSPLLASLIDHKRFFRTFVFLVQKEVAVRLAAKPSSSDYSAFSVFAQYHCDVEMISTVSRRVFYPSPDVDSAILRMTPRPTPPVSVKDEALLFAVVRAAFGQRRKSLLNALSGDPALGWSREKANAMLTASGIDTNRRGETLTITEFAQIANAGE